MAHEFTAGDMVRVKAAMFRRPGGVFIMNGQVFELTDEDIQRREGDLDLLVEPQDAPLTGDLVQAVEGEPDDAPSSIEGDVTLEDLQERLNGMKIKDARAFLSHESWTLDEMRLAREAEEAGKNRRQIIETIDNRILDLEDEDDSGAPA